MPLAVSLHFLCEEFDISLQEVDDLVTKKRTPWEPSKIDIITDWLPDNRAPEVEVR